LTYAPAGALNIAQNVLRHRGIADLTANGITRRNLEYMANLTVPDLRFGGARIIPGMGNSSNDPASGWGTYKNTWLIALPVPEGDREAVVKDYVFPPVWARPFTPLIGTAAGR
jgi:hypothetical protein